MAQIPSGISAAEAALRGATAGGEQGQAPLPGGFSAYRRFRAVQTSLAELASLPTGPLLQFNGGTDPGRVAVTASSLPPALPMILTLIPPEVVPSGQANGALSPVPPGGRADLVFIPGRSARAAQVANTEAALDAGNFQTVTVSSQGDASLAASLSARRDPRAFTALVSSASQALAQGGPLDAPRGPDGRPYLLDQTLRSRTLIQEERTGASELVFLRQQAEKMALVGSLVLMVSPATMTRSYSKIISSGNRTRTGFIVEHWGEQLLTISLEGSTGGFYSWRPAGGRDGLTTFQESSAAYQQLMSLAAVFRSNGRLYNSDGTIAVAGAVSLYYDGVIYEGVLDGFGFSEDENQPFRINYNLTMTVHYELDIRYSQGP
jgi:hypothetical protein